MGDLYRGLSNNALGSTVPLTIPALLRAEGRVFRERIKGMRRRLSLSAKPEPSSFYSLTPHPSSLTPS